MDESVRLRMRRKHADRSHTCPCGKVCWGNGGYPAHAKVCPVYREKYGVFVPQATWQAYFSAGYRSEDVRQLALEAAAEGRNEL